jgi:hypothetical protein
VEFTAQLPADQPVSGTTKWQPVQPGLSSRLVDARLQFHYAAQFASAGGISFLPPQPDDSHTNLEWIPEFRALFSHVIPAKKPFRIGARPAELALLVVPEPLSTIAECKLNRCTIDDATVWLRSQIASQGAAAEQYSLKRHYEIPAHPIANGLAFDAADKGMFAELAKWFANGFTLLNDFSRHVPGSSEVRCWPHHFDIGMIISAAADRSIGVGLEPGDDYYAEPYFYVNMSPQPTAGDTVHHPLAGGGSWHTAEWIGAVLPGSRLNTAQTQEPQVRSFLISAIAAARELTVRS